MYPKKLQATILFENSNFSIYDKRLLIDNPPAKFGINNEKKGNHSIAILPTTKNGEIILLYSELPNGFKHLSIPYSPKIGRDIEDAAKKLINRHFGEPKLGYQYLSRFVENPNNNENCTHVFISRHNTPNQSSKTYNARHVVLTKNDAIELFENGTIIDTLTSLAMFQYFNL